MKRLKSTLAYLALSTFGMLLALCIPGAQASASVPSTWHIGQVNITEIGEPVQYSSSGTVTMKYTTEEKKAAELTSCSATGYGTLGGESTLTLQGCKMYVNGIRNEACDQSPITVTFSTTMQSKTFWLSFAQTCQPMPEEIEVNPGQLNLEAGKESFHLQANINEETTFNAQPGSISGSLALSLKSPFQGKSFGAGPAPLVHIKGKTFSELGITEESFRSEGNYTIEVSGIYTLSCAEEGSGTLRARGNSQEGLELHCVVVGNEACHVEPLVFHLYGSFETTEKILTTIVIHNCLVYEEVELLYPAGYLNYGSEGIPLNVQAHAETHFGTHPVILSGSSNWYLTGKSTFQALGIW